MDCGDAVGKMFTDAQLLAIGAALTTMAVAAATLGAAYCVKVVRTWKKWLE